MSELAIDTETVDRLRGALTRIARRVDRQVSGGDLSSRQLSVLALLAHRGPLGLGELAEIEGINPTMLSRIVGKLEEEGLIQRQVDPGDRRAARVEATSAGIKLRNRLLVERSRLLTQTLATLPAALVADIAAAAPGLEALADALPMSAASRPATSRATAVSSVRP